MLVLHHFGETTAILKKLRIYKDNLKLILAQ
jgi:hypothetical protein